jgi:hypothetical protein
VDDYLVITCLVRGDKKEKGKSSAAMTPAIHPACVCSVWQLHVPIWT